MGQTIAIDTRLGRCQLSWRGGAVTRFLLPGSSGAPLDRPDPPDWLHDVVDGVVSLLEGDPVDLAWVPVDLGVMSSASSAVYEVVRTIPPGRTMTYGEVAAAIDQPGGAQAVGAAMGRNPVPLIVPCHRVVGADGRMVGFSAPGGTVLKRRLLEIEGAAVVAQRALF